MRAFIAVDLVTPEVQGALGEISGISSALRTVAPENLHLTLKFLGEIQEGRIDDVHRAMEDSLAPFAPFEVSLHGVGVFPGMNYIKVVWVGIDEGREQLIGMQKTLDDALSDIGFKKEKRGFHPHLTLARMKGYQGKEEVKGFVEARKDEDYGLVKVSKVELIRSVLTPQGPIYSTLKEVSL